MKKLFTKEHAIQRLRKSDQDANRALTEEDIKTELTRLNALTGEERRKMRLPFLTLEEIAILEERIDSLEEWQSQMMQRLEAIERRGK